MAIASVPPIMSMANVMRMKPMSMRPLFLNLSVKRYIKGQLIAYNIAGIPKAKPIFNGEYP